MGGPFEQRPEALGPLSRLLQVTAADWDEGDILEDDFSEDRAVAVKLANVNLNLNVAAEELEGELFDLQDIAGLGVVSGPLVDVVALERSVEDSTTLGDADITVEVSGLSEVWGHLTEPYDGPPPPKLVLGPGDVVPLSAQDSLSEDELLGILRTRESASNTASEVASESTTATSERTTTTSESSTTTSESSPTTSESIPTTSETTTTTTTTTFVLTTITQSTSVRSPETTTEIVVAAQPVESSLPVPYIDIAAAAENNHRAEMLRVCHLSDFHNAVERSADAAYEKCPGSQFPLSKATVIHGMLRELACDFTVFTGDLTHGGDYDIPTIYSPVAGDILPFWRVNAWLPGNHEFGSDSEEGFTTVTSGSSEREAPHTTKDAGMSFGPTPELVWTNGRMFDKADGVPDLAFFRPGPNRKSTYEYLKEVLNQDPDGMFGTYFVGDVPTRRRWSSGGAWTRRDQRKGKASVRVCLFSVVDPALISVQPADDTFELLDPVKAVLAAWAHSKSHGCHEDGAVVILATHQGYDGDVGFIPALDNGGMRPSVVLGGHSHTITPRYPEFKGRSSVPVSHVGAYGGHIGSIDFLLSSEGRWEVAETSQRWSTRYGLRSKLPPASLNELARLREAATTSTTSLIPEYLGPWRAVQASLFSYLGPEEISHGTWPSGVDRSNKSGFVHLVAGESPETVYGRPDGATLSSLEPRSVRLNWLVTGGDGPGDSESGRAPGVELTPGGVLVSPGAFYEMCALDDAFLGSRRKAIQEIVSRSAQIKITDAFKGVQQDSMRCRTRQCAMGSALATSFLLSVTLRGDAKVECESAGEVDLYGKLHAIVAVSPAGVLRGTLPPMCTSVFEKIAGGCNEGMDAYDVERMLPFNNHVRTRIFSHGGDTLCQGFERSLDRWAALGGSSPTLLHTAGVRYFINYFDSAFWPVVKIVTSPYFEPDVKKAMFDRYEIEEALGPLGEPGLDVPESPEIGDSLVFPYLWPLQSGVDKFGVMTELLDGTILQGVCRYATYPDGSVKLQFVNSATTPTSRHMKESRRQFVSLAPPQRSLAPASPSGDFKSTTGDLKILVVSSDYLLSGGDSIFTANDFSGPVANGGSQMCWLEGHEAWNENDAFARFASDAAVINRYVDRALSSRFSFEPFFA